MLFLDVWIFAASPSELELQKIALLCYTFISWYTQVKYKQVNYWSPWQFSVTYLNLK